MSDNLDKPVNQPEPHQQDEVSDGELDQVNGGALNSYRQPILVTPPEPDLHKPFLGADSK